MDSRRLLICWVAGSSAGLMLLTWLGLIAVRLLLPGSIFDLVLALVLLGLFVLTLVASSIAFAKPAGPRSRALLAASLVGAFTAAVLAGAVMWNVRGPLSSSTVAPTEVQSQSVSPDGRYVVRVETIDVGAMASLTFPITVSLAASGSPRYEVDLVSADDLRPPGDPTSPDFGISWERPASGWTFFVGPRRYAISEWPPTRAWWDLSQ